MQVGYTLDADSIASLRSLVERLQNQVYDLATQVAVSKRAERASVLIGKVGSSLIAGQSSGTAASASVTIQKIDRSTGALTDKAPTTTVTAWNIYDQQIPANAYVVIARDFVSGQWLILSRMLSLWRYTLNADFSGSPLSAAADLLEMDGTDTGEDITVYDYLNVFGGVLSNGDAGYCCQQGAAYHAIQAPCPAS